MTDAPRRTCVVCRSVREKPQLVRLVRLPEGTVVVDGTGMSAGRGAYVCKGTGCAPRLIKGARLSQAFRRPSTPGATLVGVVGATAEISAECVGSREGAQRRDVEEVRGLWQPQR